VSEEKVKWQDMSKEELFMMAKWHEARSSALLDVIAHLTTDPETIPWRIEIPENKTSQTASKE
jgi:hypothetical protein